VRTYTEYFDWPYTTEEVFDLVADVERYPEFVPGWSEARIHRREGNVAYVEQIVRFGPLRGGFDTRATISRPDHIRIAANGGLFRRMSIDWSFAPREDGCGVRFELEYELASKIVERLSGPVIDEAFSKVAAAFEARARSIYGAK